MTKLQKVPELKPEIASQILSNAFAANDLEENKVPLEVLAAYSNYRKERYILQRVVVVLILLLFLMMPVLFIAPKVSMAQVEDVGRGRPAYEMVVKTKIPITQVSAVIDGVNMPVYEVDENTYSIQPTTNGKMVVTATLLNDQSSQAEATVTMVDIKPPVLVKDGVEDDMLCFYISDDVTGVNYSNVYGETMSGKKVYPANWDEAAGRVAFDYPEESVNMIFEDMVGNRLQIVVTLQPAKTS